MEMTTKIRQVALYRYLVPSQHGINVTAHYLEHLPPSDGITSRTKSISDSLLRELANTHADYLHLPTFNEQGLIAAIHGSLKRWRFTGWCQVEIGKDSYRRPTILVLTASPVQPSAFRACFAVRFDYMGAAVPVESRTIVMTPGQPNDQNS
jgi:hypothetical protein